MKIDYSVYLLSWRENSYFICMYLVATLIISFLFYDSFLPMLVFIPISVYARKIYQKYKIRKRKNELYFQFRDMIQALSASLSVGYAFENAFSDAYKEMKKTYGETGMIVQELQMILRDIQNGKNIEDILQEFGSRSGIRDIYNFAQLIAVSKRTGGNMVQIMKATAANISQKAEVESEITTLIAAKRYEQRIMIGVPFLIIGYMRITNPSYISILYESLAGRFIMTLCLVISLISVIWSKKIISIGV